MDEDERHRGWKEGNGVDEEPLRLPTPRRATADVCPWPRNERSSRVTAFTPANRKAGHQSEGERAVTVSRFVDP